LGLRSGRGLAKGIKRVSDRRLRNSLRLRGWCRVGEGISSRNLSGCWEWVNLLRSWSLSRWSVKRTGTNYIRGCRLRLASWIRSPVLKVFQMLIDRRSVLILYIRDLLFSCCKQVFEFNWPFIFGLLKLMATWRLTWAGKVRSRF